MPHSAEFEASLSAISRLSDTLAADFDLRRQPGRKRPRVETLKRKVCSVQQSLRHHRSVGAALRQKYRDFQTAKGGGRIKHLWFTRILTTPPNVPCRALSDWLRDWPEVETRNVSSWSIAAVRDAGAQVLKSINRAHIASIVERGGASSGGTETHPVFLTHAHDEAAMRLKSYGPNSVTRGRSSKIQNHVVRIHTHSSSEQFLTELQPLLKKDAGTIAHAMIAVSKEAIDQIVQGARKIDPACATARLIHIIVGDGIQTNDSACRRLLHYFSRRARELGIRYGLVVCICASHKANLVVVVAICGHLVKDAAKVDPIAATCTRVFKYLVVDYLEEFSFNLRRAIGERLTVVHDVGSELSAQHNQRALSLQRLYGEGVLPPALLGILNRELFAWEHCCPSPEERPRACSMLFDVLSKHLLRLEERPVPTRFWLFTSCVWALLLMDMLGLPTSLFKLDTKKPQKENADRLGKVLKFFQAKTTPALLRKAALCLRLSYHAVCMSAQTKAREDDPRPLAVRLAQGEVQKHTAEDLGALLPMLTIDPSIHVADTVAGLLTTQGHIVMRFETFAEYPFKLWELSQGFNAAGWKLGIDAFLSTPQDELDAGYSLPLQERAWGSGSEAQAANYLMSSECQSEIDGLLRRILCNSLDVERKHFQDRCRCEKSHPMTAASGSRNTIISTYQVQRNSYLAQSMRARARAEKGRTMNSIALARKEMPHLVQRPRGKLRHESCVTAEEMRRVSHVGDPAALEEYHKENESRLKAQAELARASAREEREQRDGTDIPFTNRQWLAWFEKNDEYFSCQMREATAARKPLSQRLAPADPIPAATLSIECPRLRPRLAGPCESSAWQRKLHSRKCGFASLLWAEPQPRKVVFFFVSHAGDLRFLLLLNDPVGANRFLLPAGLDFATAFLQLDAFLRVPDARSLGAAAADDIRVWALQMEHLRPDLPEKGLYFKVAGREEIPTPKREPRAPGGTGEDDDMASESGDACCRADSDDADSVVSEVEPAAEAQVHEEVPDDPSSAEGEARAAPGTYSKNNGYFTFTDHPAYDDIRVKVLPMWARSPADGGMGKTRLQHQATVHHYDDDPAKPRITMMVLRSWMIERFQEHGFSDAREDRRAWLRRETDSLLRDIHSLDVPGGGTGSARADAKIKARLADAWPFA